MITANEVINDLSLRNAIIRGNEITCSCPFTENHSHGDAHPSFGINMEIRAYHCFSCGQSGSLVHLFQCLLGLSYMDAIRTVFSDLTVQEALEMMSGNNKYYDSSLSPLQIEVDDWYQDKTDYWHTRGLNDDTIGRWKLGYDRHSNRVVVPIYQNKELVGWTKRRINETDSPKWQHSPDFQKNLVLFGLDNASGEMGILVEAPLSAIKLDQYGIKNAVASFGCSLSDEQALLLRAHFNKVLIWYDPDEAGFNGTVKAVEKLKDFVDVFVMKPAKDDPAALTKEECEEALNHIIPYWEWKFLLTTGKKVL